MLRRAATDLLGALNLTLFITVLAVSFALFLPFAVLKLLLPVPALQRFMTRMMTRVSHGPWRLGNAVVFLMTLGHHRDIQIDGTLSMDESWLLVSNHRSWVDIPLLVDVVGREIPFPRFFLKRQLLWVPIIGFAGWALDMPFMKRHTRAEIAANPALAREDLETTRRACEKFRSQPVTVVNFLEGTRFTPAKHDTRSSPFQHLLRPKSGGLAFAVDAMGEQFAGVIDVTLAYRPSRRGPLWSFLCGDQRGMQVHVAVRPLPAEFLHGHYQDDPQYRARFQTWVNDLWRDKEARIERYLATFAADADHDRV